MNIKDCNSSSSSSRVDDIDNYNNINSGKLFSLVYKSQEIHYILSIIYHLCPSILLNQSNIDFSSVSSKSSSSMESVIEEKSGTSVLTISLYDIYDNILLGIQHIVKYTSSSSLFLTSSSSSSQSLSNIITIELLEAFSQLCYTFFTYNYLSDGVIKDNDEDFHKNNGKSRSTSFISNSIDDYKNDDYDSNDDYYKKLDVIKHLLKIIHVLVKAENGINVVKWIVTFLFNNNNHETNSMTMVVNDDVIGLTDIDNNDKKSGKNDDVKSDDDDDDDDVRTNKYISSSLFNIGDKLLKNIILNSKNNLSSLTRCNWCVVLLLFHLHYPYTSSSSSSSSSSLLLLSIIHNINKNINKQDTDYLTDIITNYDDHIVTTLEDNTYININLSSSDHNHHHRLDANNNNNNNSSSSLMMMISRLDRLKAVFEWLQQSMMKQPHLFKQNETMFLYR